MCEDMEMIEMALIIWKGYNKVIKFSMNEEKNTIKNFKFESRTFEICKSSMFSVYNIWRKLSFGLISVDLI